MAVGFELAFEPGGVREGDAGGVVLVGFGGAEDARGLDLGGFDRGDAVLVRLGDHLHGVLLSAHDVLERSGDVDRAARLAAADGRMRVVHVDADEFDAESDAVAGLLDAVVQVHGDLFASGGDVGDEVGAGEIARGLGLADREKRFLHVVEIERVVERAFGVGGVEDGERDFEDGGELRAGLALLLHGHEELVFVLVVVAGPEDDLGVAAGVQDGPEGGLLHVLDRDAEDLLARPRQFEVDAGVERRGFAVHRAEDLADADLAGIDLGDAGEEPQNGGPDHQRRDDRLPQDQVDAGPRNLESELVVQRIRDVAHHAARLGEDREQTAFVDRADLLQRTGAVELDDEAHEEFGGEDREDPEEDFGQRGGPAGPAVVDEERRDRAHEHHDREADQPAADGAQIAELADAGLSDQEHAGEVGEERRDRAEERQIDRVFRGQDERGGIGRAERGVLPEEPERGDGEQEDEERDGGRDVLVEVLEGALRREADVLAHVEDGVHVRLALFEDDLFLFLLGHLPQERGMNEGADREEERQRDGVQREREGFHAGPFRRRARHDHDEREDEGQDEGDDGDAPCKPGAFDGAAEIAVFHNIGTPF